MAPHISCETARRWIALAVDDELPPEGEPYLESHLDICLRCRRERDRAFARLGSIGVGAQEVTDEIDGLLEGQLGIEQLDRDPQVEVAGESSKLLFFAIAALVLGLSTWAVNNNWDGQIPLPNITADLVTWSDPGEGIPPVQRVVHSGETLLVGTGGLARLTIEDLGSVVEIGGGSRVRWPSSGRSESTVDLPMGVIRCDIDSRGRGFEVRTENLIARVTGTRFIVSYSPAKNRSEVTVQSGVVLVSRPEIGGEFEVKAGEKVVVVESGLRFYPAPKPKSPVPGTPVPATEGKTEDPAEVQQGDRQSGGRVRPLDLPGNRGSRSRDDGNGGDDEDG